jgi:outer membrane protein insertion porin family
MVSLFAALQLAYLAALPTPDAGLAPLQSLTVDAVGIEAPQDAESAHLLALVDIAPGQPLSQEAIQRAISRLYALGRFAQVRVWAEPHGTKVNLRFALQPTRRLEGLQLDGTPDVDTDRLAGALGINAGDEVDSRTEGLLHRRAVMHLMRAGYPLAEVQVACRPGDIQGLWTCHVGFKAGPAVRVTAVRFAGQPRLPAGILQQLVALRAGHVLDRDVLEADQASLKQIFIARGFLRVQVHTPWVKQSPAGAEVTYEIEAGPRIAVSFRGNRAIDDATLMALWPEPSGAMAASTLDILRQRIEQAYGKLSYIGTEVQVQALPGAMGEPDRYVLQVHEGQPVAVEHVDFKGVHAFAPTLFDQQVRALLARELDPQTFFEPLGTAGNVQAKPPQAPWAPSVVEVPAEQRWVPNIYQQAADEIAAAYRDVGYLQVAVQAPQLVPKPPGPADSNALERIPCSHLTGLTRLAHSRTCDVWAEVVVDEGPQSFIESIGVSGNTAVTADRLLAEIYRATSGRPLGAPLWPGAPLSNSGVEDGRIQMIRYYRDQGYLYARVYARVSVAPDGIWARVQYTIEEGPQVHVERILLRGNMHTRSGVIRSRMAMHPGDVYRLEQAVADQRSIGSLNTFSSVRVKLLDEERPATHKDLVAELIERPRHTIEVVPGLSTAKGPRVRLGYAHNNVAGTATTFTASLKLNRQLFFVLFGNYAENLSQRYASYSGSEQLTKALEREGRLGLRSPPIKLLPFDPLLRLDLVDQRINAVRYSLNSTTAIFGIDMVLPWRIKPSLEVQVGLTNLECPLGDACNQNLDVRHLQGGRPIQEGEIRSIKFGPLLTVDRRDSPLSPSRGFVFNGRVTQDFGQARPNQTFEPFAFTKYEAGLTGYVPLWRAVLALSARFGTIDLERSSVPVDERFFLGGRDSLRGFVESTLIPQDACVVPDPDGVLPPHCAEGIAAQPSPPLSLGGNTFMLLKTELRLPLRGNISFDVFVDAGNLWVDTANIRRFAIRIGTGVGLRYATPVGALAIDFGFNPAARAINAEPTNQVHFSIGSF